MTWTGSIKRPGRRTAGPPGGRINMQTFVRQEIQERGWLPPSFTGMALCHSDTGDINVEDGFIQTWTAH